jgi:uncharacterized protein YodC (DUF2158 family)
VEGNGSFGYTLKPLLFVESLTMDEDYYCIADFEVGELIILRSGGPTMTIHGFMKEEVVGHWFTEDGLPHIENFRPPELKKVKGRE